MTEEKFVTYHSNEMIGTITLNRPERRNALTVAMWNQLDDAVRAAKEDDEVRVVIVKGSGKSFCVGLDLSPDNGLMDEENATASARQKVRFFQLIRHLQDIHIRLEHLSKPTIAAIHGHCLGGGMELALCCDIRICTADTLFGLPEPGLAIITDVGGLQRLTKVVGRGHARELSFRGNRFGADHAREINLVNNVCADPSEMEEAVMSMAQEIADNSPLAVQGIKEVMAFNEEVPLPQALAYNAARSSMIIPSNDLFEAFIAHSEKRKGDFKGK